MPIETFICLYEGDEYPEVAFTPKGGCPLKLHALEQAGVKVNRSSIHPQGWVPIETLERGFHFAEN